MISGSRTALTADYAKFKAILDSYEITEILHGGANGYDYFAQRYATEKGLPTKVITPNYATFGAKFAPLQRNIELVKLAEKVICFYNADYPTRTKGTHHTAKTAAKMGKLELEVWKLTETSLF